jgi:enediyne biosynthesis protein E4
MDTSTGAALRLHSAILAAAISSLLLVGSFGCWSSPPQVIVEESGPAWFEDVTDAVGLDFVHDAAPTSTYFTPLSMGSGCAFFDFDGDGLVDIYLLHLGGPGGKKNQLYKQMPDHTFRDVSPGSGLDIAGYSHGVAIGDVNNDGKPDVLVTQFGAIRLFLNLGDGKFADVTAEAGLSNPLWAMSAAFVDYDRDGLLDLVVINYLDHDESKKCTSPTNVRDFCGPNSFTGVCSKLFHNRGARPAANGKPAARVAFEDVSFASGIGRVAGPGLGVVTADFDGDGWPDIFVVNDGEPNRLWINQKDGTFVDQAMSRGLGSTSMGASYAGMGIGIGDTTGSGMFDIFVTHLDTQTHTLWRQSPRGLFRDQSAAAGLMAGRARSTGWGTVLTDFDLDGAVDLAIANGRVYRRNTAENAGLGFWSDYAEKNHLYANDGTGRFRDIAAANPALCGYWNVGRGLACADFDNDGAPDLLVTATGGRARLFRNVAPNRGHWLKVRAIEPSLQRDAIGAEVRVRAGNKEWLRLVQPAQSYLSSGSPLALFGLGTIDRVTTIGVTWPDGTHEHFGGGTFDCMRELRRGEGRAP